MTLLRVSLEPLTICSLHPALCPLYTCTREHQGDSLQDWGVPGGRGSLAFGGACDVSLLFTWLEAAIE